MRTLSGRPSRRPQLPLRHPLRFPSRLLFPFQPEFPGRKVPLVYPGQLFRWPECFRHMGLSSVRSDTPDTWNRLPGETSPMRLKNST